MSDRPVPGPSPATPKTGSEPGTNRQDSRELLTQLVAMRDVHCEVYGYEKQHYIIDSPLWAEARAVLSADFDGVESATPTPEMRGVRDAQAFLARCVGYLARENDPPWSDSDAICGKHVAQAALLLARDNVALSESVAGLSVEVTRLEAERNDARHAATSWEAAYRGVLRVPASEADARLVEALARLSQIEDERATEKALVSGLTAALERARLDLREVATAGWDSTRLQFAAGACDRIDVALARLDASQSSALPDGSAVVVGRSGTGAGAGVPVGEKEA